MFTTVPYVYSRWTQSATSRGRQERELGSIMPDEANSAPPAQSSDAPPARRQPREKTCYNCGESGHIARDCSNPRLEGEARQKINKARTQFRRCFNCGKTGHISADCTKPAGNKACYNCGQEGHIAKDCPNPREE